MTLISLDEFRNYTRNEISYTDDAEIIGVLEATDRLLADLCHRKWEVAGDTATTRYYSPRSWTETIRFHDCVEVTAITADGVAVSSADYQLEPLNGLDWAGNSRPYEQARLVGQSRSMRYWPFDDFRSTVAVTARWGWPEIPSQITRAAFVLAKDISMHRDISFGAIVVPDLPALRVRQASLISDLVKSFRRPEALGGIGGPK